MVSSLHYLRNFSQEIRSYNINIKIIFISSIFTSIGYGAIYSNLLSIFIKQLNGTNLDIGLIATASGIASTIILIPAGILADRWHRDYLIYMGQLFSILGLLVIVCANDIYTVFIGDMVAGLSSLGGPPLEALIADSSESEKRPKLYGKLFFIRTAGAAVGPFFNITLFLMLGDTWALAVLRQVMMISVGLVVFGSLILLLVKDKLSSDVQSEIKIESSTNNNNQPYMKGMFIPIMFLISGIIIGFGAGMTVQYFAVFFKEEYGLLPIYVNFILGLMDFITAIAGVIGSRIAGNEISARIYLVFTVQMTSVVFLLGIALYPPLIILVFFFISRNALMNASEPVSRTIVMDLVAKEHRAKFNALEQLSWGLFWNVSAGVGGFIIGSGGRSGFQAVFLTTATLYTIATFPLLFLARYARKLKIVR